MSNSIQVSLNNIMYNEIISTKNNKKLKFIDPIYCEREVTEFHFLLMYTLYAMNAYHLIYFQEGLNGSSLNRSFFLSMKIKMQNLMTISAACKIIESRYLELIIIIHLNLTKIPSLINAEISTPGNYQQYLRIYIYITFLITNTFA